MKRNRKPAAEPDRKEEETDEQVRERIARKFIAVYGVWKFCGNPKCRRERGCAGDACACFPHCWELLPEQDRTWYRVAFRARHNGLSDEEAVRAADAALARDAAALRPLP